MVNLSWKSHRDLFLLKMRLLGARPGLFYKRNGPLVTAAQGPGAVKQCIFSQWGKSCGSGELGRSSGREGIDKSHSLA